MDRIKELLSRIEELSDSELQELRDLVIQEIEGASGDPEEMPVEELELLASVTAALQNEHARREQVIADSHEHRQTLAQFRRTEAARVPDDRDPRRAGLMGRPHAVTASGGTVVDRDELSRAIGEALRQNNGLAPGSARIPVATLKTGRDALPGNDREAVVEALTASADAHVNRLRETLAAAATGNPKAITAAGGLGAPEDTDYTLIGFEAQDRPAKSALPTQTTTRGGIRFMRSPTLSATEGAHTVWTVEDDIQAATDESIRKPSLRVEPGPEIIVNVQAITNILTFGNLMQRAYPEFVSRITDLSFATHARLAERQLVTQIGTLCTGVTGTAQGDRGTTRILLPLLERAALAMRDRQRMKPDFPLQLFLPHWAKGVLRTDLALQEPGDASLGVTDQEMTQYLAVRNIAVTWLMEGEAGQSFDAQAPGNVVDWPTRILCYLFPAGAFQFLDGGTLDLGVMRDSTLNAANDWQMFVETFEAAVFRGGESFRISVPVNPSGIARAA